RSGTIKTYRNLWIVFLVSGFWHGANWTYLAWGFYNGFFIFLDRIILIRLLRRVPVPLKIGLFYMLLIVGYVLFRSETITGAFLYIHRMFDVTAIGSIQSPFILAKLMGNRELFVLIVCLLICFFPQPLIDRARLLMTDRMSEAGINRLKIAAACLISALSLISMINNSFSPFIYFRF
ncbi:MAG TPA: MBOAT family O-acyltransferase, partial [Spirochaetota bacterium]|nr:MBOAT family O-acyltransferase [Spirochaetota bacterium]